jgi:hypothetical protein
MPSSERRKQEEAEVRGPSASFPPERQRPEVARACKAVQTTKIYFKHWLDSEIMHERTHTHKSELIGIKSLLDTEGKN